MKEKQEVINIAAAKARLPELVELASQGRTVILARNGKPRAKLVPLDGVPPVRRFGAGKGKWTIGQDFDAPLPPDVLNSFAGRKP